jgi:hypothetical protein
MVLNKAEPGRIFVTSGSDVSLIVMNAEAVSDGCQAGPRLRDQG